MKTFLSLNFLFCFFISCSPSQKIHWYKGNVQQAFKQAKLKNKPLFIYWSATWCPPCNRIKANVFTGENFQKIIQNYIAVYLDGDQPRAQVWAERLEINNYPTLLVLNSKGHEIMRLPTDANEEKYVELLSHLLKNSTPIQKILANALNGKKISTQHWNALAFYGWSTDQKKIIQNEQRFDIFSKLYNRNSGQSDSIRSRFFFEMLSNFQSKRHSLSKPKRDQYRKYLRHVLKNQTLVSSNIVLLSYRLPSLLDALNESDDIFDLYDSALVKLIENEKTPIANRVWAINGRIELQRKYHPTSIAPLSLKKQIKNLANHIDRDVTNKEERRSSLSNAIWALVDIGELNFAKKIAMDEILNHDAVDYLGPIVGYILIQQGKNKKALKWYRNSYYATRGSTTGLQRGVQYIVKILKITPKDFETILKETLRLIQNAFKRGGGMFGRNQKQFNILRKALLAWAKESNSNQLKLNTYREKISRTCDTLTSKDCLRWSKKLKIRI